jgi:hypothetical protein
MTDEKNPADYEPQPDPGNSPPEAWTEPLSDSELQEVKSRLASEKEEAVAKAQEQGADFVVVDGKVLPVAPPKTEQELVVENADMDARKNEEPSPPLVVEEEVNDGSSSPSN